MPCVQIRNLVLSAFPRSMKLPDPFMPNLKVDLLTEIKVSPRILTNYVATLLQQNVKVRRFFLYYMNYVAVKISKQNFAKMRVCFLSIFSIHKFIVATFLFPHKNV